MVKSDKENFVALSDDELDQITGGWGLMTLESIDRGDNAVLAGTLEDRKFGKKKCRRGARVETLEQTEKKGHNLKFL